MRTKKTLSVIRGNRGEVADFYRNFSRFKIKLITGWQSVFSKTQKDRFEFYFLPFYKPLKFDPASLLNQRGNLSWTYIKDLEECLGGSSIVSITDTYYFFNLQAVNWACANSVPMVTVIWCTIPNHITSWFPPYSFITKKVVEATDLFILRSKTALQFTDSLAVPRSKTKVIYKGVDLHKFSPSPVTNHQSPITVLFTGNLSKAKGLDDLLFVFEHVRKHYKDLKLVIAGDGELRRQIMNLHGRGVVDYRGFVPYEKLPDLYREADIYCAPSKYKSFLGIKVWEEYFSYALMEALGSGLPIVTTSSGGIEEEVGSKNLLIEPGNRHQLKKALTRLIESKSLRLSLALNNRKRAEELFDAKKQAELTEKAILEVV
ncbi:hypothetical protein A2961_00210 [Candidatus Woesebacteria bacterium RIFCSPLOWO2_01_FULL_39_21]|uniref:Glycosyl transferase family 1 domain-containing protein n=1 Tax=Candidatus Woesebacteria bacterium RIFCSPLOWO2_01_FULL_39_21 TaxID=1802519 RepID=A0A1F8BK08_9BACT|nr:MAG: hypothetical protein A2961_00210 [Candidatus Woesebacteria bacterium RIFCSPLOWO2_01_FULL_39_21]